MKSFKAITAVCALFVAVVIAGCGSQNSESNNSSDAKDTAVGTEAAPNTCASDGDCVPDACCHAKGCVAKANGPKNCAEMMCTEECREGTMDCGAGQCACLDGECAVKWKE